MSPAADCDLYKELAKHIKNLTHSGEKSLDENTLKEVKNLCKLSDSYVEHAYHTIMKHLDKSHAEIRFSAFQLCREIFQRSHVFRKLLVANLQHFLEMTVETNPECPLPQPRSVALDLKKLALQTIHEWNKTYGSKYKELHLGYNFLKQRKKVDFAAMEMEIAAQQARQQELERRVNIRNEQNINKVTSEVKELESEILSSMAALENCISLLLPPPDEFFVPDVESMSFSDNKMSEETALGIAGGASRVSVDSERGSVSVIREEMHCDVVDCASNESEDDEGDDEELDLRRHGLFNTNYNIEIKLKPSGDNKVSITEENRIIVDNAIDHYTLINKRYLPTVNKWIIILTKCSGSQDDLKKLTELKQSLEAVVSKFMKLNVHKKPENVSNSGDDDSSCSDFEEVENKAGYEETAVVAPVPTVQLPSPTKATSKKLQSSEWTIAPQDHEKEDPTTALSTISMLLASKVSAPSGSVTENKVDTPTSSDRRHRNSSSVNMDCQPSTSTSQPQTRVEDRKTKLLAIAPKLPYDIDLYHWEDEKLTAPTMLAVKAENSRFWSSTNIDEMEEVPVPEGSACLRTRVIEFTGQFEPVTRACRAPLPNGKLCPRHDRYKCPFHGPIVPRDETGKCVNAEDDKSSVRTSDGETEVVPDWQDPQLLAEIKAATGIDLKMPEKKIKGRKKKQKKPKEKKYPGLTNLKVKQNTVVNRLSKKVFKKSTMKRVASTMDKLDRKKFHDKFGDQFNYMY